MPMGQLLAAIALTFIFRTEEWNGVTYIKSIKMEMTSDVGDKSKSTLMIKPIVLSCLPVFTNMLTDMPIDCKLKINYETQTHPLPRAGFERRFVWLFNCQTFCGGLHEK